MKKLLFLLLISFQTFAQLQIDKTGYYRVDITTPNFISTDTNVVTTSKFKGTISLQSETIIKIRKVVVDSLIYFSIYKNVTPTLFEDCLYVIQYKNFSEKYFSLQAIFKGGMLTVPFKYYYSKYKFLPGGNISLAGSYTYYGFGFGLQILIFSGISTVTISDINASKNEVETKVGVSFGFGINLNVINSFNYGFVMGFDFVDEKWELDKRPWISFSFNYNFL